MGLAKNQLVVLSLLAEDGDEHAGIELANAVGGIGRSSVYAALAALQRDGMVSARWDVTGSRPQRLFQITAAGSRALAEEQAELRRVVLRMAPQGA